MVADPGINFWYLAIQIVVLGIACLTPLAVMWLAFRFVGQRQTEKQGELLGTLPVTAEGVCIEPHWLKDDTTAVAVYRHGHELHLRPATETDGE